MKEIYAIIQINKINPTKKALEKVGIYALNAYPAFGHGKGQVDPLVLKSAAEGCPEAIAKLGEHPTLVPKRSFSIMVEDDEADKVVKTIIEVNQTGNHGDGKIFVCPVENAIRIRTGETGSAAL